LPRQTFLSILSVRHVQFVDIACGHGFCAAITNRGLLYTWYADGF
jgi:alpha-tubulin suppressor-like RCC1 family protein